MNIGNFLQTLMPNESLTQKICQNDFWKKAVMFIVQTTCRK